MQATDGRRARGDRTRQSILDRAVQIASAEGLEGLSIGRLASDLGVSKSGLFAHFGSKTELQLATVDEARQVFIREVIGSGPPDSGIGGVMWLTDAWLDYMEREVFVGGCFFAAASLEFDSRPGPVRDRVASMMGEWLLALEAAIQDAQESGELPGDLDSEQLAFEINSLGLGANWAFQLYRDEAAFARARAAIHDRLFVDRVYRPRQTPEGPGRTPARHDRHRARRAGRPQLASRARSRSWSASFQPCSYPPIPAARSSGRSARRVAAARECSTSATSRRFATSWPAASRRSAAS